ncbi:MAG TPA: riboflavin biosynthesis protein RibF, partial [Myxococcaceae bacterium]|nr:riboflavin biosynthesis protein RibF [Myxococcaceae bacterium]
AGGAVTVGNFDGVHLGHQALFHRAAALGVPAALTFHPHPGKVLQPELAPKLITTLPRKLELFAAAGLTSAVVVPFTDAYARTSAEAFEASLLDELRVAHLVVGRDFTYGARRAGTVGTLEQAAARRSASLQVVDPVTVEGVVASSSRIREYLLEGRVSAARALLGRSFDLDGVVVRGAGRGQTLGWPTANVDTDAEIRPGPGVYAVRLKAAPFERTSWLGGAANVGSKPTFGGTEVTVEVHVLDWSGDLYGQRVRVEFLERLRPEQRFGSAPELAAQIRRDVEAARVLVARAGG